MNYNKQHHKINDLNYHIRNLRLKDLNYQDLVNEFLNTKGNQFDIIVGFINEFSKKDPLDTNTVQFFKYLYGIIKKIGKNNLEQHFVTFMPFNNICWNNIYDNNIIHHCEIINIFHDLGFSIDTKNNQNEDAITSLCATSNNNIINTYNDINNRMGLFNTLMNPTKSRIKSIIGEILSNYNSNNIEHIKKIKWCLLINPHVTINKIITYFLSITNKNKNNNICNNICNNIYKNDICNDIYIYEELVNYLCKSITGIDKIRVMKKLGLDIKLYISENKSKYDIYIGQNNDKFMTEIELKKIMFDLLVNKGYHNYKEKYCLKFKSNENNKIGKISTNIDNHKNFYDSINKCDEIKILDKDMEFIIEHLNIIKNILIKLKHVDENIDNNDTINNTKLQEEYNISVLHLEDYIFSIIKYNYIDLHTINTIVPIKYSYLTKLYKAHNLNQFTTQLNGIFRNHILNEIICLEKLKQNILNNFERNMEEYILELDNTAKVNGYILMCFLICKNMFSLEEINVIKSKIIQLSNGNINDINVIYICIKCVPSIKKHFSDIFLEIAKNIKLENNIQKKYKMMDILEYAFNIKISPDTNFKELENTIINTVSNTEQKMEKVNYAILLQNNMSIKNIPIKNIPIKNIPIKNIPIKKNDTKKQLCKFIGLGEKCVYGKKCKFSHRIN